MSVGVSPDGSLVFVTGSSDGGTTSYDYVTFAYDAKGGERVWAARYNRSGNSYDEVLALAVSPDGQRVFVTGFSEPNGEWPRDYATVAYNARTGHELWTAAYEQGDDSAIALAVSPDSRSVFVTGFAGDPTSPTTVAYDAATGAQLWAASGDEEGAAYTIAVSPDGSLVFVGGVVSRESEDLLVIAFDSSSGDRVWESTFDGPGQDLALDIGVSPDGGRVYVTGWGSARSGATYLTLSLDAHMGQRLWTARYQGPDRSTAYARALGVSPTGDAVYVTGWVYPPGQLAKYVTVAYDATTGTRQWTRAYHGPGIGYDEPDDLVVSPSGDRVYVTGIASSEHQGSGYGTVAYDAASGAQVWSAVYTGPDPQEDDAYSIAVSPDGGLVFVTGRSYGPNDSDYATVAYATS
jgi:WD40 repeat protein